MFFKVQRGVLPQLRQGEQVVPDRIRRLGEYPREFKWRRNSRLDEREMWERSIVFQRSAKKMQQESCAPSSTTSLAASEAEAVHFIDADFVRPTPVPNSDVSDDILNNSPSTFLSISSTLC